MIFLLLIFLAVPSWAGYKQLLDPLGNVRTDMILRTDDNANIPVNPQNRDYQEYLVWVSSKNVILPPDPVEATGPQPLSIDQRVADLEAAVNQLSVAVAVPVSLPTTTSTVAP